tara:strand:- start:62 stop:685 length:624 start_codon:yes stop_codon:yes gene_type:complete
MEKVILIEQHKISLIDSSTNSIKWKIDVSNYIKGSYRLDNYIFLYTYDWKGSNYTSLIDIDKGTFYWKEEKLDIITNCVAINNKLFFVNSSSKIIAKEIESGDVVFEKKFPYKKWFSLYYPKVVVYNGNIIVFSKKKAVKLDLSSYKMSDFIFRNINLSTIESMNDKFNIAVNKYTSSGTGGEAYMYGAVGGDAGGGAGDAGGGAGD